MEITDNKYVAAVPEQELVGTKSLLLDRFPVPIRIWEPDRRPDLTDGNTRRNHSVIDAKAQGRAGLVANPIGNEVARERVARWHWHNPV